LHFVNWNFELYKTPSEAMNSNENDGLLVIAKFIQVGNFNPEFEKLTRYLHDIHLKDHSTHIEDININNFLSSIANYIIINLF
jgi:carbonic anhydrase